MTDAMVNSRSSPWWYRSRALIFGFVYALGFSGAALYDALTNRRYVPLVQTTHTQVLAVMLVAACLALRVWGSAYLSSRTVWSANSVTGTLVTGGPFAYTRNPLYLGNVLMALGIGASAPAAAWAFINIAQMVFIGMLIRWEERGMRTRYGESFDAYCAHVPQLFPVLAPAAVSTVRPSLYEGLRAEVLTAALLAGSIAVAASQTWGWTVFFVLYTFGIITQITFTRKHVNA